MSQEFDDLLELGNFYILSQEFEQAVRVLKMAEKIERMSTELYNSLGMAYEGLSEKDKARDSFRLVLKLDPNHKSAQEHLTRLIEE